MTAAVYQIQRAIVRLECSACGAEANASCDCGKPYVAMEKAKAAVIANPEKSNRALAQDAGVSYETVRKARAATDNQLSVDGRVGLDGKVRKLPQRAPADDDVEDENATWLFRAEAAWAYAKQSGIEPAVLDQKTRAAIRAAADAWNEVLSALSVGEHHA